MSLLPYALGFGLIALLTYFGWDLWSKNKKSMCMAFISEMIGEEEVLIGWRGVDKVENKQVTCLKVKGYDHSFIDMPSARDYFHHKEHGRVLFIVKYGERDYRIKKKFDGTWFKKVQIPVVEESPDEDGNVIQNYRKNDEGNLIYEVIEESYVNPVGVDQKGMDAIRTSLINEEQIDKELEVDGFWNKYGNHIIFVTAIMICALMVMKVSGDVKENLKFEAQSCIDTAKKLSKISDEINEPIWAEKVLGYVQTKGSQPPDPS